MVNAPKTPPAPMVDALADVIRFIDKRRAIDPVAVPHTQQDESPKAEYPPSPPQKERA